MKRLLLIICFFFFSFPSVLAQSTDPSEPLSPIIFIYDASGSMWGQMSGKTKVEIAREVLSESVEALAETQQIGLVAYGHRKKGDCKDVEFMVGMDNTSKTVISETLNSIKPLGNTPLAFSAGLVIDRLKASETKATVILVTDGIESCDGDICKVVAEAKAEGVDFKLHIIGFGLKPGESTQLECAAKAGDGRYFDAEDADGLGAMLESAIEAPVGLPSENFSVYAVKNGKPIDALVTAYDVSAKRKPIRVRTYRDTGYVYLPPSNYNLEVRPLEGSDVENLTIEGIKSLEEQIVHQTVSFDAGKVSINATNNGENWDCVVKLMDGSGKVVATVRTYDSVKELDVNPGLYTMSIQATKMNGLNTMAEIENIRVVAGNTEPVSYEFDTGVFSIETLVGEKGIDCSVFIDEANSGKNVAGGRTYGREKEFLLNTGDYKVRVVALGENKDKGSQSLTLSIEKGQRVSKRVVL